MLDYGIFYEFYPAYGSEQEIVSLADVKLNKLCNGNNNKFWSVEV